MIERDKRAVLIANNFFKSQLFFNKSYALRSVGYFEVFGKADKGFLYRVVGQQLAHFDGLFYLQQPDAGYP